MSLSPSKRQRTSFDTFVVRDHQALAPSNPTTPTRRASYLSPTKASLARSHPKLLLKSPGRNMTGTRSNQVVDGTRSAPTSEGQLVDNIVPIDSHRRSPGPQAARHELQRLQGEDRVALADAIAQAFGDIPTAAQGQGQQTNDIQQPPSGRAPLSPRQPRIASAKARKVYENEEQTESILPKLVKQQNVSPQHMQGSIEDEIELPPTPVQLGLSQAPYRPRGLASSSSGGSRSGSGRHRMRTRNNESRSITSSPLKPRHHVTTRATNVATQRGPSHAQDDDESEAEQTPVPIETNFSPEARQKQEELAELEAELRSLREDLKLLETLSDRLRTDEQIVIEQDVHAVLLGGAQTKTEHPDSLESHTSFVKHPNAFLTLFAPAGVQLSVSTKAKTLKQKPKVIHSLVVTAPDPWPESTLQLACDVTVDAEKACIESISMPSSKAFLGDSFIPHWISARLANPVHQLDIAGIVFGTGRYFDASVTRASIFQQLTARHATKTSAAKSSQIRGPMNPRQALSLSQYMQSSQLLLLLPSEPSPLAEYSDSDFDGSEHIVLTYELDLSWTGDVRTTLDVTCSHLGPKAHKDVKELFQKLVVTEGVVGAFDRVWKLIESKNGPNEIVRKHPGQLRKARKRIVV